MARESTVPGVLPIAADQGVGSPPGHVPQAQAPQEQPAAEDRSTGEPARWRGAGGRWTIWLGRAVLWAVLAIVLANGVVAIFQRSTGAAGTTGAGGRTQEGQRFPTASAAAFAAEFGAVYLNYDQTKSEVRARRLGEFLPEGADERLGWNGAGHLKADWIQVAGVDVRDDTHAVVTLSVRAADRRFQLAVPVYASNTAMVVSGQPALLPPPPRAALPPPTSTDTDSAAEEELRQELSGFFRAFASGDDIQLRRYLAQGASLHGLGGSVSFVELRNVVAPAGGASRQILAKVVWQVADRRQQADAAAELEQTYQLTVEKQGEKWYVRDIRGATGSLP